MQKVRFWEAVATLVGTIVGAGILGLPYAVSRVGGVIGLVILIGLGLASLLLNLMFAEVILRTHYRHQLAGYVRKYLGNAAFWIKGLSMLVGGYGALLVYFVGEGEALSAVFGGDKIGHGLLFFALAVILLAAGLKVIKIFELWMVSAFVFVIAVILGMSSPDIIFENFKNVEWGNLFTPYGTALFAFSGAMAVVPLREILRGNEKFVKRAVIVASVIPIIMYVIFVFVVLGVTGALTTEVATIGLGKAIGSHMVVFGNLFAIFAMGTSFLTVGLILQEYFQYDLRWSKLSAWLATITPPLIIFWLGARSFVETMAVAGSITVGLTGISIVSMFWRAKKEGDRKPEFSLPRFKIISVVLIAIFSLGLIYAGLEILEKISFVNF